MSDATDKHARRLVLLCENSKESEVESVLLEYAAGTVAGTKLHADLVRFAEQNRGRTVAAEWSGSLGWTRFLWCCKDL
jgi:hypothetical protein